MQEATAAHIHEGAVGKEGAVTVALDAPKTGSAKGCTRADAPVMIAIMQKPDGYYVNVHNAAFPKGACAGSSPSSGCAHQPSGPPALLTPKLRSFRGSVLAVIRSPSATV
jgi:hypothetical protein